MKKEKIKTVASRMRHANCKSIATIESKLKKRDKEVPSVIVDVTRLIERCRQELADWISGIGCAVERQDKFLKVTVPRNCDWRRLMAGLSELNPNVNIWWPGYPQDGMFFAYMQRPNAAFAKHCRKINQFPTMTAFEDWSGITAMRESNKITK